MKLSKEEKKFWQRNYRIENAGAIDKNWGFIKGNGDEYDDEFFYFLSLRVSSIAGIRLTESVVTDEGVKYMTVFKGLSILFLRKNDTITKASILNFNQMKDLESLDITKTKITLSDLCKNLDNQSLKEVFVSSEGGEGEEKNIVEKAFILKERMPDCNIYLDTCFSTNFSGNPERPIF
jgi:hypothetical protein